MDELRVSTADPGRRSPVHGITIERLRTIIQDSHLNFLIGAGTSSAFFARLGDIEQALTQLSKETDTDDNRALVRASLQGYFFKNVVLPNKMLIDRDPAAKEVVASYVQFFRSLNSIVLKRRTSLIGKQINLFTTNVDVVPEVALELLEIDTNDGFVGRMRPRFDIGEFNTLRFRQGIRFEYRSEVPTTNLFKIHGSVSWKASSDGEIYFDGLLSQTLEVEEAYSAAAGDLLEIANPEDVDVAELLARAAARTVTPAVRSFTAAYDRLSIVNPEKTKFATTVLNKTYYELLRRFANELEKENSVLFVHGFSFRDEHLRDLVLRAARANPTLQIIVLCFSISDREKYSNLMPPEQVKNDNILLVSPYSPEEGQPERFLTLDVVTSDLMKPIINEASTGPDHIIELNFSQTKKADDA